MENTLLSAFFQRAVGNIMITGFLASNDRLPMTQRDIQTASLQVSPPSTPCKEVVVLDGEGRRVDRPPVDIHHPAFDIARRRKAAANTRTANQRWNAPALPFIHF